MIGSFAVDSGQFMFIPKGHASKFEQTLFEDSRGIVDEKGEKHYLWQDFMSYEAKLPGADCTVNEGVASGRYKQFQGFPAFAGNLELDASVAVQHFGLGSARVNLQEWAKRTQDITVVLQVKGRV